MKSLITFLFSIALLASAHAQEAAKAPFKYAWSQAYHVLPGTHTDESGYFSLNEGLNGKIYVGTAAYSTNAYLVEFDPATHKQRIVIDTHKLCGLTNVGYGAQSKIHTRNFVGPSGKIYVGSKQGYRRGDHDTGDYPGGYPMIYDPKTDTAECLPMAFPGQGVIDVTADEERNLLYVVTCEDQHWMRYDMKTKAYRELGPMLTAYATTLLKKNGNAVVITRDFQLAEYNPTTDKVTVRPIVMDGQPLTKAPDPGVICWIATTDASRAYLIRLTDPTLIEIDLTSESDKVPAINHGRMIEGKGFDSRGALTIGPDGRVYAVCRVDNDTGFGKGYLHHLLRFDPKTKKTEDLGVLAVKNPDFFDFSPGPNNTPKPWTHGFHKLPDGTLTPLHCHMAMIVAKDGTVYTTIIYPFTLLQTKVE